MKIVLDKLQSYPVGQKISSKSLYLARFLRYKHFCVSQIFVKNSKWPPFLVRQNFFEKCFRYTAELPCGSKILSKSLYLAQFSRYKQKRQNFFENWDGYSAGLPYESKSSLKSLYLARFSRYKHFCVSQILRKI